MAESNGSGSETSLKQIFQSLIPDGDELMQGTVISAAPLKIQMVNDEKLIINERITIVPWQLTDYNTEVTVNWSTENASGGSGYAAYASHNHGIVGRKKITVHNALKVGDKVHVLSLNHGKLYYVLDRVVS